MPRHLRGLVVTVVFLVSYILLVGALCYVNFVVLDRGLVYDHLGGRLDVDWPVLSVLFAPPAAAALLAAWWSKQSPRDTVALLARFVALLIIVIESAAIWQLYLGRYLFLALLGAQVLLIGAFFLVGILLRIANNRLAQCQPCPPAGAQAREVEVEPHA